MATICTLLEILFIKYMEEPDPQLLIWNEVCCGRYEVIWVSLRYWPVPAKADVISEVILLMRTLDD